MIDAPRSILVINVTRIGDTLLATPALRALAETWPDARITVLGHPKRVEVLEHLPFLAEVGEIEKKRALLMGRLSGKSYDLALVYGHDQELVAYALRVAHKVVAFKQEDASLNARLYRLVEEPPPYSEHAVDLALRLPAALGITTSRRRLQFQLTADEQRAGAERLRSAGLTSAFPLIGLQAASFPTKAFRDWPVPYFVDLCQRTARAYPEVAFLLFGGPDDSERAATIAAGIGARTLDLSGLPLRPTAAMMAQLTAYVGVDTGPTHIMSTFDVPMVGLYHCRLPRSLYGPLDHPLDFSLDHPRLGEADNEDASMSEMSVDMVYAQLEKAIRAASARPMAPCR